MKQYNLKKTQSHLNQFIKWRVSCKREIKKGVLEEEWEMEKTWKRYIQQIYVKKLILASWAWTCPKDLGDTETLWRDVDERPVERLTMAALILISNLILVLSFQTYLVPSAPFHWHPTRRCLKLVASFRCPQSCFGPTLFGWRFAHEVMGNFDVSLENYILPLLY